MNAILPSTLRLFVRFVAAVSAGVLITASAQAAPGAEGLWLVSSRQAPVHCPPDGEIPLNYWRLSPDDTWLPSDEGAFRAADAPGVPTCIFVHGNRAEWQDAVEAGGLAYWRVKQQAAGRPFRFVIWSWPSEQVAKRNRPDAQEKALRSDVQAVYLAQWLDRFPPETPLSLIGYSFGARIVTGAMHRLGGEETAVQTLPLRTRRLAPVRAVLVAAALDQHWLLPGHCHGSALRQLEQVLITVNNCDPALRWYSRLWGRRGPEALGYAGLGCPDWLGPEAAKVEQINVSCEVGREHAWACYISAPSLLARLGRYTFLPPVTPPSSEPERSAP
jgi:hypothetical protein